MAAVSPVVPPPALTGRLTGGGSSNRGGGRPWCGTGAPQTISSLIFIIFLMEGSVDYCNNHLFKCCFWFWVRCEFRASAAVSESEYLCFFVFQFH